MTHSFRFHFIQKTEYFIITFEPLSKQFLTLVAIEMRPLNFSFIVKIRSKRNLRLNRDCTHYINIIFFNPSASDHFTENDEMALAQRLKKYVFASPPRSKAKLFGL